MSKIAENVTDLIGNTPLVKVNKLTKDAAAEVVAKLEFFNPLGSVKDRLARFLVEEALADGRLQPGGTVVEASSGNTAMGLR